jgi:hypothetical protein
VWILNGNYELRFLFESKDENLQTGAGLTQRRLWEPLRDSKQNSSNSAIDDDVECPNSWWDQVGFLLGSKCDYVGFLLGSKCDEVVFLLGSHIVALIPIRWYFPWFYFLRSEWNIESVNLSDEVVNLWIFTLGLTLSGCWPHTSSIWPWSGAPKVRLYGTFMSGLRHPPQQPAPEG